MTPSAQRAVVLLSGGMDSCVCAPWQPATTRPRHCTSVTGSAPNTASGNPSWQFAIACNIHDKLVVRNEALRAIGGSALTDENIAVPTVPSAGHGIPVTYVPFRNAHFLSVAVSWAEVLGAAKIYIGAVEPDSSGYPDCRPAYYEAFNRVIQAGTKEGNIEIVTPLIAMRKAEIVRLALN